MTDDPFGNVTPIRPKRTPRADLLFSQLTYAGEIEPQLDTEYLVKAWITRSAISVVYGPPNVGKSFLALDIAHAVAKGRRWASCRVRRAPVVYITLEGGAQFDQRVKALDNPEFWVLKVPVNFMDKRHDPTFLAEMLEALARTHGPIGLIIVDTLARAMAGGDENSSQDMGKLIASVEHLRDKTGAHVMLIHHAGKNAAQGARGHSSLRAAIDTEIELTKGETDGLSEAVATKQRDMAAGRRFVYRLNEVELGRDTDGDPVTTCVVEQAVDGEEPRRARIKGKAEIALQALSTAIERHGSKRSGPDYPDKLAVTEEQWKEACSLHDLFADCTSEESERKAFQRVRSELNEKRLARSFNRVWWLV